MQSYFDSTRNTTSHKIENDFQIFLILRQSYWDYLTTKTSKTNGFDTIEINLVYAHMDGSYLKFDIFHFGTEEETLSS